MKTLFAHLALGFSRHPENLATDALGYLLQSSPTAARALESRLRALAPQVPSDLDWKTQVSGDDDARPDLVGNDGGGVPRVILEAKFWAGLTENQPVTYLRRLSSGGVLCVVGPAKRHSLLVGELARRIAEAGLSHKAMEGTGEASVALVGDATLIVVSWRLLVDAIIADAERAGERDLAENARQLQGLCDEQDSQAFLPLCKEELTAHAAYHRVIQFGELVDELADRLGPEAKRGLRTSRGNGYYGRYLWLRGVGVLLLCDIRKWLKFGYTPLWLSAYGPTFKEPGACRDALAPLGARTPSKVFLSGDGAPTVALFLRTGAEKHDVLANLQRQIAEVAEAIAHLAVKSDSPPQGAPPAETDDGV